MNSRRYRSSTEVKAEFVASFPSKKAFRVTSGGTARGQRRARQRRCSVCPPVPRPKHQPENQTTSNSRNMLKAKWAVSSAG
jgi:hypothetical protein